MVERPNESGLSSELGLFDSAMMVAGSMIGSGIFIVSAEIARTTGSAGWLLVVWLIAGAMTVAAALSYGELAALLPRTGGQYVYLREAFSPLWGFLYGWTFLLVIQSGTIAAVAVGFAKYLGVLIPWIAPDSWMIKPIHLSHDYALSLSTQQFVGIICIALLTLLNTFGLRLGKWIQNIFTSLKTLALLGLIVLGILWGRNCAALEANFTNAWFPQDSASIVPDFKFIPTVTAAGSLIGLLIALCVSQTGSLFSADAWNNVTFTSEEVKDPRRNLPLSLAIGTSLVIVLYLLANVAYLVTLPLPAIQHAPDDRVATATLQVIFGNAGAVIMALAIVISTFGCNNGLILAGARVPYAMALDNLFFRVTSRLNRHRVPAVALVIQGIWAALLILPRTRLYDAAGLPQMDPVTGMAKYGNLYGNLLDYVVSSVLIFYILTLIGVFVLRRRLPDAERTCRAFGYPLVPVLYIAAALLILGVLAIYKTQTTWPGLIIVLTGVPVYVLWRAMSPSSRQTG